MNKLITTSFILCLFKGIALAQGKNPSGTTANDYISIWQIIAFIAIACIVLVLIYYILNRRQKRKFNE